MKGAARAGAVVLALLAFVCGFVGVAAGMDVTQPSAPASSVVVSFQVYPGDTVSAVANRLQAAGLIRNALLFRLLARLRHLDANMEPGTYQLSPNMSMDAVIAVLLKGVQVQQVQILVPPGLRVSQYAGYFAGKLPSFDAHTFMQIVTTGVFPDGTKVSSEYWYVLSPRRPNVPFALEGYLFPDTYDFDTSYDARKVIERLLDTLGEKALCPGPDPNHPDAYIHDQTQCLAHAHTVNVGSRQVSIFTEMEGRFFTKDPVTALYDTLTLASIVVREIEFDADAIGVADVYYNRYLTWKNNSDNPAGDYVQNMGADPTAQYALETDHPPTNGKWWAPLPDAAKNVDPGNLYNTAVSTHAGLMPGPIAAPKLVDIEAAAKADDPTPSPYYFFVNACGKTYYARSYYEFINYTYPHAHHLAQNGCKG
jgi:UPF0755 protein